MRLSRSDAQLIGLTLALKLLLLIGGAVAFVVFSRESLHGPRSLLEVWDRWDAPHYTDLAVFGYRAVDAGNLVADGYRSIYPGDLPLYIVFYPLFPWVVAAVAALTHDAMVAAIAVSTVASLFVAPLLARLVALDFDVAIGRRAAIFLLIFPTAYFLHIGYTESLFLALVLGSFVAARTDRWWLAGLLGALATLTRVNGLVLVPALAAEALAQWWPDRQWRWRWLGIAIVPLGFVGYLALNQVAYGDPLAFLAIQQDHWFKSLSPPGVGIGGVIESILTRPPDDAFMLGWMELGFIGLGLVATVVAALRFRPSWAVWMAGNWLLITSTSFVLSVPRYTLVLFPLFAWFALLTRSRWVAVGLGVASVLALGYFAGRFAAGQWAF
jgi:dolichyl-phosphate-mannose-protein mannosyltransferase